MEQRHSKERNNVISIVTKALSESSQFLKDYLSLANAHPTHFIVNNLWDNLLPQHIQEELLALSDQELCKLPLYQHLRNVGTADKATITNTLRQAHDIQCISSTNFTSTSTSQIDVSEGQREGRNLNDEFNVNHDTVTRWDNLNNFLLEAQNHSMQNLPCTNTDLKNIWDWLEDKSTAVLNGPIEPQWVNTFMKKKKLHEVEIMATLCTQLFYKSSANIVVDIGSGKGYLSTHMSLHSGLPVVGIDSQPVNTVGAKQLATKLGRQWHGFLRNKKKKQHMKERNDCNEPRSPLLVKLTGEVSGIENLSCSSDVAQIATSQEQHQTVSYKVNESIAEIESMVKNDCVLDKYASGNPNISGIKIIDMASGKTKVEPSCCHESNIFSSDNSNILPPSQMHCHHLHSSTSDKVLTSVNQILETSPCTSKENLTSFKMFSSISLEQSSFEESTFPEASWEGNSRYQAARVKRKESFKAEKYLPITLSVGPKTNLTEIVELAAKAFSLENSVEELKLLLTGLHTCGGLGATMLKLFSKDKSVRAMCGVGCCYQLMRERFQEPTLHTEGETETSYSMDFDFPLSSFLQKQQLILGNTALNIASLSLPRMTNSDGKLQGQTYYPRALLQVILKEKLGKVPENLKNLRKMTRHATSPSDYVIKALHKLNLQGLQVSEEEIAAFHCIHAHQEKKMAAFFQLRAALSPVVETVVLLDRLLFLLEQECVQDAFLVQLFDPITSPRCYALIAVKK